MDNKLDSTPFPADIAEMVLNKETRFPALQNGKVFVSATITDNGPEMRYRLAFVGPAEVNGRKYDHLCVDVYCASLAEVADKLRNGFFTPDRLREAGATRDKIDADRAIIEAANKARKEAR
jgi:hypothetical protein